MNKLLEFLKRLLGPRKSIEQCLREVAESIDEKSYNKIPNVQGMKLPVEHLKLVVSNKDE